MNRRFVWQLAMRIKQDLHPYNAPIYLRTECSERKKRRGPNKKKIREINSGLRLALRIWSASPFAEESGLNIYNPRIYWRTEILCVSLNDKVIAYSFSCYKRKRKYDISLKNCMFKLKINFDRHGPRLLPNICLLPNPHCFSFPPTFKVCVLGFNVELTYFF